jgi:polyhydroxyalkanoate synthesis repressor PhaR
MQQRGREVVIKKYSNRRLYDTAESRYITLDELAATIRSGKDVRVYDAKTNEDLTQATLAQIILESRRAARLLPVPLLTQLIRMGDDALAEFFGRYMSWALQFYQEARAGAQAISPYNPFATLPFAATSALARFFTGGANFGAPPQGWDPSMATPPPPPGPMPEPEVVETEPAVPVDEIASLREEIAALKAAILTPRETPPAESNGTRKRQ